MKEKQQKRSERATNAQRTGDERATNAQPVRSLFVPLMVNFRNYLKKEVSNSPQIWLPIECNLIFRYEFAACSIQTRYVFVAILLYCGQRGIDEIPDDKGFLASALNADARTIEKSLWELENFDLLIERKKEREEKEKDTDRQNAPERGVSVDSENLFQNEEENEEKTADKIEPLPRSSQFPLEDVLRYVMKEVADGKRIENPNALASQLHKTGQADAFIKASLYPDQLALEQFGEPRRFTGEPCSVCFGAKMSDADGRGYRACVHCKNERGKSTGFEPSEIS